MMCKLNVCVELEALWEWEQASLCAMIQSPAWTSRHNPCYFYSCRLRGTSHCKETAVDTQVSNPHPSLPPAHTSTLLSQLTTLSLSSLLIIYCDSIYLVIENFK